MANNPQARLEELMKRLTDARARHMSKVDMLQTPAPPPAIYGSVIAGVQAVGAVPIGLRAIMQNESAGGKLLDHALVKSGPNKGHRAGGAFAVMPLTFKDTVRGHKDLMLKYGHLADAEPDVITKALTEDQRMSEEIARRHYSYLMNFFKGDHVRAAHAWLHGAGGTMKKTHDEIMAHPYVQSYLAHYAVELTKSRPKKLSKSDDGGKVYVSADGDGIGALVEAAAQKDSLEEIKRIDKQIVDGQERLRQFAKQHEGEVYIDGGDDIAFTLPKHHMSMLEGLRKEYHKVTGHTLTVGVGQKISEAAHALMLGKLKGKDRIETWGPESEAELKRLARADRSERDKLADEGLIEKAKPDEDTPTYTREGSFIRVKTHGNMWGSPRTVKLSDEQKAQREKAAKLKGALSFPQSGELSIADESGNVSVVKSITEKLEALVKSRVSQNRGPGGKFSYDGKHERICSRCGNQFGKHLAAAPHPLDDGEKQCEGFKPVKKVAPAPDIAKAKIDDIRYPEKNNPPRVNDQERTRAANEARFARDLRNNPNRPSFDPLHVGQSRQAAFGSTDHLVPRRPSTNVPTERWRAQKLRQQKKPKLPGGHDRASPKYSGSNDSADHIPDGPTLPPLEKLLMLKMAIKDLRAGERTGKIKSGGYNQEYTVHDYDHILSDEHRKAGYSLQVHQKSGRDKPGIYPALDVKAVITHRGKRAGRVGAYVRQDDFHGQKAIEPHSEIDKAHRGKGLGVAAYEALYAHAKHKMGIHSVKGSNHSTDAQRVHKKLSEKHGLNYKATKNKDYDPNVDEPSDALNPYSYALKSEEPSDGSDTGRI